MNRTDRGLVVVAGLCAVVWGVRLLPRDVLHTLVGTVLGTVVGGVILAGLLSFALPRWWREKQEADLLRGFQKESDGNLNAYVPVYKAVSRTQLQDPSPVLERLQRKQHITPGYRREITDVHPDEWGTDKDPVDPDYFAITDKGRLAAARRCWWQFWR